MLNAHIELRTQGLSRFVYVGHPINQYWTTTFSSVFVVLWVQMKERLSHQW